MEYKLFIVTIVLFFLTIPRADSAAGFAFDLYKKCADHSVDNNIIVSPFSVANALALLSQGAQGITFDQIAHGLHLEANKTAIADAFATKTVLLKENAGQAILSVANQIYVQQGYQIQQTFHDVAVNKFKSGVENVNFADSSAAAQTINAFVEQQTNNKIKNLFNSESFTDAPRLVLVNAIYFKGVWEQKFLPEYTNSGNFYLNDVNTVSVDFMHDTDDYNYVQINELNASAVELKYANSSISFVVVLPNSRTGLSALEASLANYDLTQIINRMRESYVTLSLPKFKTEYKIQMNQVLKDMGMTDMFETKANLGGVLSSSEPLQVSEVVHKAFIEINEEGSEAAAATGLQIVAVSARYPRVFNADHPFFYYIMDKNTNTVLFTGCYKKSV